MHAFLLFNDLLQIQLNCMWPIKMQISEDNFRDSRSRRAVGFRKLDCLTREFKWNSPTPRYFTSTLPVLFESWEIKKIRKHTRAYKVSCRKTKQEWKDTKGVGRDPGVESVSETPIAVKRIYDGTCGRFTSTVEQIMTLRGSGSLRWPGCEHRSDEKYASC